VAVMGWLITTHDKVMDRRVLGGDLLAGLALAVLATKPQALGLPIVLIALWALSRRRFAIPLSALASYFLLLVLPALLYPSSLGDWFSIVFGKGQATSQSEVSASVWGLAYQWLGEGSPWKLIALVLTIAGVVAILPWWWRDLRDKSSALPMSLALTLCMNSVISPYMLGYEHVLLLVPALMYLAASGLPTDDASEDHKRSAKKTLRMAIYTWICILPFFVLTAQALLNKEYPAIAQSASMLLICWAVRLRWTTDDRR